MAGNPNSNIDDNPWNPFTPTKRDIQRTQELALKDPVTAGLITFLFLPIGLLYLNRGVNSLKLLGYMVGVSLLLGLASSNTRDEKEYNNLIGFVWMGCTVTEQFLAVKKARERLQLQGNSSYAANQFQPNNQGNFGVQGKPQTSKIVQQLNEITVLYNANQITEEEFKALKEKILNSL